MLTRSFATAAVALLFSLPLAAQQFVYPRPDPATFTVRKDIPYGDGLRFDLYRPAGDAVVPLIVFSNVGISGMKGWPGYVGWGEAVAAAGLGAVHYDAADGKQIENFTALMATLRAQAQSLKIDPDRVVIWGASTNVRLALPLAMDRANKFIKGAIIYYGFTAVPEFRTDLPVYFVRAGLERTEMAREIDAMLHRAIAANAPWTIENYGGGLHGFDLLNDNDVSRELIRRSIEFAARVTRPALSSAYAVSADDAALGAAFNRGEWETSIAGYSQRVAASPRDAESHRKLGLALYETGRYAEALSSLEAAFRAGAGGPRDTMVPAARAAVRAGNGERAMFWIDRALSSRFVPLDTFTSDPVFAEFRETAPFKSYVADLNERNATVALLESERPEDGLRRVREARSGVMASEAWLINTAYRLLAANRTTTAIALFTLATQRYPRSANAWESLSEAEERAARPNDAVRHAKKALTLDGPANVRQAAEERVKRLAR